MSVSGEGQAKKPALGLQWGILLSPRIVLRKKLMADPNKGEELTEDGVSNTVQMAPMTRAQRRKAIVPPGPRTLPNTNSEIDLLTPAEPLPAPTFTTPPKNPRAPSVITLSSPTLSSPALFFPALSSSDHTTDTLTRSAARRLFPPRLLTPTRAPSLTTSLLTLEAITANQNILSRNVEALHNRMERIENLLHEVVHAQKIAGRGIPPA
ncbi:hypothetical protein RUND412_006965 [Rhizina undulata]